MSDISKELSERLRELEKKSQSLKAERLSEAGRRLSPGDIRFIECIGENPGIPVSAAAEELDISRPSATAAANRLEAKGIIAKTGGGDGRNVNIKLTGKGESVYSEIKKYNASFSASLKENFGGEELSDLFEKLEKLGLIISRL